MAEELGRIEKPPVESFKKGRKLYFIPLVYRARESPQEYVEKCQKYWAQVEQQLQDLELKLGRTSRVYHELIAEAEDKVRILQGLNEQSYQLVQARLEKGAELVTTEERDILTEFIDWGRCLGIGLQNQKVFLHIYQSYLEAIKKRMEFITKRIGETLGAEETGLLFIREGSQIQFPPDIEVFYVAPPALDEINRWLRDREAKADQETEPNKAET
ncbi:MAG: hypothetical protein V1849_04175 [Chloroflexota bacterium]